MNVSKALAILRISEKEYCELSDLEFRKAFTRQQIEVETTSNEETVPIKNSRKNKSVSKIHNPIKVIEESKKKIEKNMKMQEAFQYLGEKRSTNHVRKIAQQETASTIYSVGKSESVQSWGSQDLAGTLSDQCCESLAPKRRGSISPFLVGPGTPPPIDIPELTLDNSNDEENDEQSEDSVDKSKSAFDSTQLVVQEKKKNSASADGGPRSRVCARETLCSAPHRH